MVEQTDTSKSNPADSAAHLLDLMEAAFPLQPLPEMSLHQAHLSDQSMTREITEDEWRRAGELDAARTWKEYSDHDLISCDAALAHLEESSFVYYLPAYLLFAVRHRLVEWPHPAWALVGSVVFSVTRRTPHTLGRFKRLTPEQRDAVIAFLRLIAECRADSVGSDAQKALTRYWLTDEATKPLIIIPNR
jgi:hypothetical protein